MLTFPGNGYLMGTRTASRCTCRTSIASVKLSSSGYYAFGIKPAVRGQIAYRVWFPVDADHAQALSPYRILTIS
jgi:hypothetical protein